MAEHELTDHIGAALASLLSRIWERLKPKLTAVIDTLVDIARPEPPMTMRTIDGYVVTGVVIIDRGRVIALVGTRHFASAHPTWGSREDESSAHYDGPLYR